MSLRKALIFIGTLIFIFIIGILAVDLWVTLLAKDRVFRSIKEVPSRPIGLVLGTSKYIGRTLNSYYTYRLQAAEKLYKSGKINHLLLSGDNAHRSYNEPWTMKKDMLQAGIDERDIFLDYAGFRTLDSIIRAQKVFEIEKFVIVTQAFHCERALFIAHFYNIDAICLAVPSPDGVANMKIRIREVLARVKAVLDIYILNKQPKFLGPKETINYQEKGHKSPPSLFIDTPFIKEYPPLLPYSLNHHSANLLLKKDTQISLSEKIFSNFLYTVPALNHMPKIIENADNIPENKISTYK